jgi:hypothetical protein
VQKQFIDKTLNAASSTNTMYENQDLTGEADNKYGLRYQNRCQPLKKVIKMSQRGRDVETFYRSDEFLQQLIDSMEELKRDEDAAAISRNASTAEVANTSGALMAGAATWAIHNTQRGVGAADAVLDGSTNVGGEPTIAPSAGTARAMSETMFRQAIRSGWKDGARFDHVLAPAEAIEMMANYFFTSTARVAAMQTEVGQGNRRTAKEGSGAADGGVSVQGAVNLVVTNFGSVIMTPDMQAEMYDSGGTDVCDIIFYDSRYPTMNYLHDYDRKPLGESGLYDQVVLFVDCTMVPGATHSITTVADIDPTLPMVA